MRNTSPCSNNAYFSLRFLLKSSIFNVRKSNFLSFLIFSFISHFTICFSKSKLTFFLRKMSKSRTFLSLFSSFRQLKSRKEHAHVIHRLEKPFGERKLTEIQSESRFGLSDSPINRNAIFQLNREGLISLKKWDEHGEARGAKQSFMSKIIYKYILMRSFAMCFVQ